MSSAPINLNKARKAKARDDGRAKADENSVRFGQTKAAKTKARALADRATRTLDGKKRE